VPVRAPRSLADYLKAFDFFRRRTALDDEAIEGIETKARDKAFNIASHAQLGLVSRVMKDAKRAMRRGESMEKFKERTIKRLNREWGGQRPYAIDTIWRTDVQKNYQKGRFEQLTQQSVINLRPFWMFDAVMDDRTSAICQARNGEIRAHDDPWWNGNYPPLHFNCRSGVRSLRRSDVKRRGGSVARTHPDASQGGFGEFPGEGFGFESPDLADADDELRQEFEKKVSEANE